MATEYTINLQHDQEGWRLYGLRVLGTPEQSPSDSRTPLATCEVIKQAASIARTLGGGVGSRLNLIIRAA